MPNSNIALNQGSPDPPSFARTLGQMVSIRGGQLENQQRQQQVIQGQQAMDERAQLKALLADPGDPATLFDRIDAISPTVGQAFRKSALEGQSAQINLGLAKAKRFGQIAGGIKPDDETSYHAGIASAFGEGLIDAPAAQKMLDMPPGPERNAAVQQVMQQALTTEQQLDERRKQLEDQRKAAAQPAVDAKAQADLERVKLQNEALKTPPVKPVYRMKADKSGFEKVGDVPANAQMVQEPQPIRISTGEGGQGDVKLAVQGMKEGTLPPLLPGRATKEYTAMLAEARRQNYDLAGAATDWAATQKHIQTMNGAQQLRLNQAINSLPDMLDKVEALGKQWKAGRFAPLNRLSIAAGKAGVYGREAASIANQLDAQIADVVADLGNVYMGGNSPTERALELAGKSLKSEWDEKVLTDMVGLARNNVMIRRNSINSTGVQGASADNPYGFQGQAQPVQTAPAGETPYERYLRLQKAAKK